jgi:hypothetical protein
MEHENYDLENKINLIYDYNYNLNNQNCFSFNKIIMGKIGLDDIKFSLPDSDPESIKFYESTKNDVLDGKFKILNYDNDSKSFLLKKYSNQFSNNIKINFYTNIKKIGSLDDKNNNDSLFAYLLSQLVLGKKTIHIQLPIMNIDCKLEDIKKLIVNDQYYDQIKKEIINGKILDICCLHLREHFYRSMSLEEYLKDNQCSYKTLLFQVIHTLAIIQDEFEGFRHNNLKLNNIFVYLKKKSESYIEYDGFKKDKFYLPNEGFDIKITNFENAVIPKYYGMSNYDNPSIKFANQSNQYYDLFTFLNDLLEGTTKMSLYTKNNCNDETKKFLDIVIPPHLRGLNNEKMNKNIIIARPIDLLYDKYFDEFRNKPSKNYNQETLFNHQYLTGKINTFMDSDNYSTLGQQDKIKSNYNIMITKSRTINDNSEEENKIKRFSKKILDDIDDEVINKRYLKKDKDTKKIIRNKLVGGNDKMEVMSHKAEKNNPFLSNEQKEINKKRTIENPIKEPPVLLEQKIYDTSQKPAPKPQFPPAFIPLYDESGSIANQIYPYTNIRNQPPIQKAYTVNLTGPTANLTSINRIYEDVLPGDQRVFSAISIFERKQLIDFLRNTMLDTMDGEEMSISGGKNTLLSYIKLMDINPYSLKKNPYHDLPRNFLLYRAAYPVRFDDKSKFIGIGKPSMGINIRLYMMSLGDLRCKTINNNINSEHFDLWREIKYYDIVREEIIKRKIAPNFIAPILYKIDSESKVNWDQLDIIRSSGFTNDTLKQLKLNQQMVNKKHNINLSTSMFEYLMPKYFNTPNTTITFDIKNNKKLPTTQSTDVNKEDITINSGKMLILLTEAPTSNIIQWSSTIYESFGSVKKMISSGYHTPDVWKSILFQLVYACSVLQKMGIYMEKFSLENNIYIKDIFADPNAIGSWIYKVNNVNYYVPNYGYILMIDSKFADVEIDQQFIKPNTSTNQKYKMYGNIYNENFNFDMNNIQSKILIQFKSIIDPDNFRQNLRVKGGSQPPDEILHLIENMHNKNLNEIKDYIPAFFGEFVHNRVGTLLTKTEVENISNFYRPKLVVGNIMVYEKRSQEYEWVIYLNKVDNFRSLILLKSGNEYKEEQVFNNKLYSYPENEKINFNTKKNMKYDESYIFETYNLDAIN